MGRIEDARAFLAKELGREINDDTSWDSLTTMNLTFFLEESGPRLSEAQIASLTSWSAVESYLGQKMYKALVLDADNTLWAGVIGEGRQVPFPNVQQVYRDLKDRGVILCLATRNELPDVEAAFEHPGMVLRLEDFALVKAGWQSKVGSIREIAETLNIGLDSIVFVDDSEFECESVRAQLPEVHVVHAPPKIALGVARAVATLFPTFVDTEKTAQYHALAQARNERPKFATEEEFLASLNIRVTLGRNRRSEIPRVAELTQKSNQFNLTTRRYSAQDIRELIASGADVWTLSYRDRFGDQGIVGVLIVIANTIDTFLLSCRILGRGVEFCPWEFILSNRWLHAEYIPTEKNAQVADFWKRVGMEPKDGRYEGNITVSSPSWIFVKVKE
jgi:FkbH-like protein